MTPVSGSWVPARHSISVDLPAPYAGVLGLEWVAVGDNGDALLLCLFGHRLHSGRIEGQCHDGGDFLRHPVADVLFLCLDVRVVGGVVDGVSPLLRRVAVVRPRGGSTANGT